MQNLMPPINTPDQLFHDGDPTQGIEGTIVTADYLNNQQGATRDLQQELLNVLGDAHIQPDPKKTDQLLTALRALLLSRKNPFGDIKSDGTVPTALENLGLGEAAKRNVGTGENQIPDMTSFASGDGWMKLPNGKILQYGRGAITPTLSTQTMRITFSIPFPKEVDCAMLTHSGDGGAPLGAGRGFVMTAEDPTLTGFNSAYRTASTSSTVSMNYSWWAVGE